MISRDTLASLFSNRSLIWSRNEKAVENSYVHEVMTINNLFLNSKIAQAVHDINDGRSPCELIRAEVEERYSNAEENRVAFEKKTVPYS